MAPTPLLSHTPGPLSPPVPHCRPQQQSMSPKPRPTTFADSYPATPGPHPSQIPRSQHRSATFQQPHFTSQTCFRPARSRLDSFHTAEVLGAGALRHHAAHDLSPLHEMDDQDDIPTRLAQFITTSLAPLSNPQGKKLFAHFYVKRGPRRTKTTLCELSIPEYNYGFISLINSPDTNDHDKPFMFKHLAHVNEDQWSDVRRWSEEVCSLIAGDELTWDNSYRTDQLHLKLAQQNRISSKPDQTSTERPRDQHRDSGIDMHPEVRSAKVGPPCKAYNNGECNYSDHHTQGGFRALHVCSYCIAQKCSLLPHSCDKCKSFSRHLRA